MIMVMPVAGVFGKRSGEAEEPAVETSGRVIPATGSGRAEGKTVRTKE
jgi:hypothetical protein